MRWIGNFTTSLRLDYLFRMYTSVDNVNSYPTIVNVA
jgi:hypothetical protein